MIKKSRIVSGFFFIIFVKRKKMNRQSVSSGAKWENIVGYSRAVRVGNVIEVSGTVGIDENGEVAGKNSMYQQAFRSIQIIENALHQLGGSLNDVVRTRLFVTDIVRWEEAAKAHGEFFKNIKPATSMLEVKALIAPEYLIEIEATALLTN
jgi:enamine deaminase RidA (YjgF/YER057c/UK114 family)